ncbi:MAG: hypothetical protein AB4063_11710 [Crocosphaera sp.]
MYREGNGLWVALATPEQSPILYFCGIIGIYGGRMPESPYMVMVQTIALPNNQ